MQRPICPPHPSIRLATYSDLRHLVAIESSLDEDSLPWNEAKIRRQQQRGATTYVFHCDWGLVGYLMVRQQISIALLRVAVKRGFHRQGVGKVLVDGVTGLLQDSSLTCMHALVPERHDGMLELLKRSGFFARSLVRRPFKRCDDDGVRMVLSRDEWIGGVVIQRLLNDVERTLVGV